MKKVNTNIHTVRKHDRVRPTKEFEMKLNSYHFTANGHPFVFFKKGNELVDGITGEVIMSYNYSYSLSTISKDAYKYTKSEHFIRDQQAHKEWKEEAQKRKERIIGYLKEYREVKRQEARVEGTVSHCKFNKSDWNYYIQLSKDLIAFKENLS